MFSSRIDLKLSNLLLNDPRTKKQNPAENNEPTNNLYSLFKIAIKREATNKINGIGKNRYANIIGLDFIVNSVYPSFAVTFPQKRGLKPS